MTRTVSVQQYRAAEAREMREDALMADVIKMARDLAYLVYHPHRSDHSEAGWPDLAMVRCNALYGRPRFLVVELKRESDGTRKTELTPMQQRWRDALLDAGVEWHLWRPSDLLSGRVYDVLSAAERIDA